MKTAPYLTKCRIRQYVDNYCFTSDDSKEVKKCLVDAVQKMLDNGYVDTYEDEVAWRLNKWGCTTLLHICWSDGSPSWNISLPTSHEEELKNKQIWKETWY